MGQQLRRRSWSIAGLRPGLHRRAAPRPQVDALRDAGCYRVFADKASGAAGALATRSELDRVLDQLRPAIPWWYGNWTSSAARCVTWSTPSPRLLTVVLAPQPAGGDRHHHRGRQARVPHLRAPAEFERDLIRERTRAGLAAARAPRPPRLGVSRASIYRHLLAAVAAQAAGAQEPGSASDEWHQDGRDLALADPNAHSRRIPNFVGAPAAAARLAALPGWRTARVVKANPDAPQLAVRARALGDGKLPYMAVPCLADERPFILLDPDRLGVPPRRAASITGSARAGRRIGVAELQTSGPGRLRQRGGQPPRRPRVGKGGGFSDLEFALLVEAGLIGKDTVLATTVHPLQVLDEALPETPHDFRLDVIVAGKEVITCRRTRRPAGILWEHLDAAKIGELPWV